MFLDLVSSDKPSFGFFTIKNCQKKILTRFLTWHIPQAISKVFQNSQTIFLTSILTCILRLGTCHRHYNDFIHDFPEHSKKCRLCRNRYLANLDLAALRSLQKISKLILLWAPKMFLYVCPAYYMFS